MVVATRNYWETFVMNRPLSTRAWVVQERFLSPRTIYFSNSQILWDCATKRASEEYPSSIPVQYIARPRTTDSLRGLPQEPRQSLEAWHGVLQEYTCCDLTNGDDKLLAVAGVARRFHAAIAGKYLAGLWSEHVISLLLWFGDSSLSRPTSYRARSWSWASVDGQVSSGWGRPGDMRMA